MNPSKTRFGSILVFLTAIFLLLATLTSARATQWNAAQEFSTTNNPNGAWSYGYTVSPGSFTPYPVSQKKEGVIDYWITATNVWVPDVQHNGTGSAYGNMPAGTLGLHPANSGSVTLALSAGLPPQLEVMR